jgi:ribose transport system substrate-binding protein
MTSARIKFPFRFLSTLAMTLPCFTFECHADNERIAVFTKNLANPNYQAFRLGADRAAARLGAATVHKIPTKPDDAPEQIELLDQMLVAKPDAIVLTPADDKALEPVVRRLNAARIPIVNFGNRMTAGEFVTFVGSDDFSMGYQVARHLLKQMQGHGSVIIVEGSQTTPTSRDRVRGFQRALTEFPDVRLLATVGGKYTRPDALDAMSKVLDEFEHVDAVICANDSMAMGVLDALQRAGRNALVVGNNGTIEAAHAIEQGKLLASVDYSGFAMGCITAEAAVRHLRGLDVPAEIMLPITLIDRSNFAAWLVPAEQRTCATWPAR